MPTKQKVVNVVYHYAKDSLITCNQAELNTALAEGWKFKSVAHNYAACAPYILNSPYLGISYILEKTDLAENRLP